MKHTNALCLPILFASTLFGCAAGGEAVPEVADRYASLDEFCRGRAEAECNDVVVKKCKSKSKDACLVARRAACRSAVPQGARYVPAAAETCVRAVATAYQDATLLAPELATIGKSCSTALFAGPGAARSPCTVPYDCDGTKGLECFKEWGKEQGKCLAPNPVGPGASCAGEADVCSTGFYCDTNTKACVARKAEGEGCQPGWVACVESAACSGGGPFGGMCRARLGVGEPCKADGECAEEVCEKPNGDAIGTCAAALVLSPLSSSCAGFGS